MTEKPDVIEQKTEEENKINLPILDRPTMSIDQVSGMMWVALPLRQLNEIDCIVILDRAKFDAVSMVKNFSKSKLIVPTIGTALKKTKDFLLRSGKA